MAFFNFLKKFKKKGEARSERFRDTQREKDVLKKQTEDSGTNISKEARYESKTAADVLISPHITEKSAQLSDNSVYVFKVKNGTTKPQIKKAVSELYRVNVKTVNTLNQKPKTRYFRRVKGQKSGYKIAQVALARGQKIEFV